MPLRTIYYDTETTGIRNDKDRIIEIAAYEPATERSFVKFVNPGCPIPAEVTAINNISDEMVKDAGDFSAVAREFMQFCDGDVVLIAHNNDAFDMPFLQNEFQRHQLEMPKQWLFLDSLKWSRRYRSDLPRHSLQFLRETYGIAANNAHRALDDVIVLHQVFRNMTDDLSIEQIMELMKRSHQISHMPFGKHQGKPLQLLPRDYVQWLNASGSLSKPENKDLYAALQKIGLV